MIGILLGLFLQVHMPDRPDLNDWFNGLRSEGGGLCCSMNDGAVLEAEDVTIENNQWKVRIDGKWILVPDKSVLSVPNRYGRALVWPLQYTDSTGHKQTYGIRCFLPGAGI